MIENLRVHGYKSLLMEEGLRMTGLNVLVGANASGKSTFLQSLLLLRQSADEAGLITDLHLSGDLYEAGTANDALNPVAAHRIKIDVLCDAQYLSFEFEHNRANAQVKKRQLTGMKHLEAPVVLRKSGSSFCYLNAERIGPRVAYPLPPDEASLAGPVGKFGEFTTGRLASSSEGGFIHGWSDDTADDFADAINKIDGLTLQDDLRRSQGRLDLVTNAVLGWIIPGASFIAQVNEGVDSAPLQFVRDQQATRVPTRATHVGFGLANSLPIIAGGLSIESTGLLIVENPEAHLHPFGQSRMGAFLAILARTGRQVIVETHSDHVVNGIRLAIKNDAASADNTLFDLFEVSSDGSKSRIVQIPVDKDGSLESWPRGFFDQIENDLARL